MSTNQRSPLSNIVLKTIFKQNHNTLNVCHFNACSIYPKIDYIREILSNTNIHVICVTETWLNASHTNQMVKIPNYNIIRNDRDSANKKRGGGVAIYIRNDMQFSIAGKSGQNHPLEYIIARISAGTNTIEVGCAYNPPDSAKEFEHLREALSLFKSNNALLMGDFNLNHSDSEKSNEPVMRFSELLSEYNCKVINNEMTQWGLFTLA